jgi:hypothetical protein
LSSRPSRAAAQSRDGRGTVLALPDSPRGLSREPRATRSPLRPDSRAATSGRYEGRASASRIALPRVRDDKGGDLLRIDELKRLRPFAQKVFYDGRLPGVIHPASRARWPWRRSGRGSLRKPTALDGVEEARDCSIGSLLDRLPRPSRFRKHFRAPRKVNKSRLEIGVLLVREIFVARRRVFPLAQ